MVHRKVVISPMIQQEHQTRLNYEAGFIIYIIYIFLKSLNVGVISCGFQVNRSYRYMMCGGVVSSKSTVAMSQTDNGGGGGQKC